MMIMVAFVWDVEMSLVQDDDSDKMARLAVYSALAVVALLNGGRLLSGLFLYI